MRDESNRDPEFLSEALELVIECRIVLKNTVRRMYAFLSPLPDTYCQITIQYVMAYYIPDDEQTKKLFEFTQGRAEHYTGRLHLTTFRSSYLMYYVQNC